MEKEKYKVIYMGFKDFVTKLMPKLGAAKITKEEIKTEESKCSLCNQSGADKKWMGQTWHTKCLRTAKKMAKKMI